MILGWDRRADRTQESRRAVRAVLQNELHHRQGRDREDRGGVAGRRERDAVRARHLVHRAGAGSYTEHVRVVSIVGRLLEHSRIYGFGPRDNMKVYLSSADLMTRNMDKRIEIAWPVLDSELREQILGYLDVSLSDTAKLRELMPDGSYTPLGRVRERRRRRRDRAVRIAGVLHQGARSSAAWKQPRTKRRAMLLGDARPS